MLHFNFRNIISFGYTDFWSKNYLILYPFLGILTSHIVNSRRICTLVGNLEESQTNNFLWKCTLGCLPSYWGVKNICYGGWWKLLALFCNQDQKNRRHNGLKCFLKIPTMILNGKHVYGLALGHVFLWINSGRQTLQHIMCWNE